MIGFDRRFYKKFSEKKKTQLVKTDMKIWIFKI